MSNNTTPTWDIHPQDNSTTTNNHLIWCFGGNYRVRYVLSEKIKWYVAETHKNGIWSSCRTDKKAGGWGVYYSSLEEACLVVEKHWAIANELVLLPTTNLAEMLANWTEEETPVARKVPRWQEGNELKKEKEG